MKIEINDNEWTSKKELMKHTNTKEDEIEKITEDYIKKGFAERNGDSFRLTDKTKRLLSDNYLPVIRNGYLHLKHKMEERPEFPEEIKKLSKEIGMDLSEERKDLFDNVELFELDEKTKWILCMTNNEIFERSMPYQKIVLDMNLQLDDKWFKGFLITKNIAWSYWGNTSGFCDNAIIIDWKTKNITSLENQYLKFDNLKKSTLKKLKVFICNFFDFINNPEVRIIRFVRSQKNIERRKKQGKEPLPPTNKIRIDGVLRSYYEKLDSNPSFSHSYRFHVRGHFVRLWNKQRYRNLYQNIDRLPEGYYIDNKIRPNDRIIMFWKKPFIKGNGVLISKKYEVKKQRKKLTRGESK